MVLTLASLLLSGDRLLFTLEDREKNTTKDFRTLPEVQKMMVYTGDVYLLTSSRTFSAAEGYADILKNLNRAVVVGEKTRGGAHIGRSILLTGDFLMWLPHGRVVNPVTNSNWEGTGIQPDVPIREALALSKAHLLALNKVIKDVSDKGRLFDLNWTRDQLLAAVEPAAVSPQILSSYVGKYTRGEVILENRWLWMLSRGRKLRMTPLNDTFFVVENEPNIRIEFIPGSDNKAFDIKLHLFNGSQEILKRRD